MNAARRLFTLALVFAAFTRLDADTLHLKTGKTLEGTLAPEEGDDLVLKFPSGGSIRVARSEVEWVQWSDENAAFAEYQKRRKPGTADALFGAGEWAAFHGMKKEAEKSFRDAVAKDPMHEGAHKKLGHRLLDGKWLTDDDYMLATGWVRFEDRWIKKEDKAKVDAGWEYVDGQLLSPDDAKKARGMVLQDGKWLTKQEHDAQVAAKERRIREEKESAATRHSVKDDEAILKQFGQGFRIEVGSRYRLITNVQAKPADFDKKLIPMMDAFWNYYCETFNVHPIQKTLHNIVVYNSREEYDASPGAAAGAYGVYQHGAQWKPAVLWYMEELRGSSFTSRHECGHQFVAHYVRQDGEAWFGEGIATTFECVGDVPFQDHLYRWNVVRKGFIEPGGFKLADMISGKVADKGTIYCIGAATHIFFLEGQERAYRAKYQEYLKTGDTKSPEAFAKALGKPLADLQVEFEAWVKLVDAKRTIFPEDAPKK